MLLQTSFINKNAGFLYETLGHFAEIYRHFLKKKASTKCFSNFFNFPMTYSTFKTQKHDTR